MKKALAIITIVAISFVTTVGERFEKTEIKKKLNRSERRAEMKKKR